MTNLHRIVLAILILSLQVPGGAAQSGGLIHTVAGNGIPGYAGDGGPATAAQLNYPSGVAVDPAGNLYIADWGNHCVRKVALDGSISTVAGTGAPGAGGDGGPAILAQLNSPMSVAVDSAGNLYIADMKNDRIRKVNPAGVINTVVAKLGDPNSIALDFEGNLYISDSSTSIRKVAADGRISTVMIDPSVEIWNCPIAVDPAGNLYFANFSWFTTQYVYRVAAGGSLVPVAGGGGKDPGDGGPATSAYLSEVHALAFDTAGNLFLAESGRIRKVTPDGVISTVAGTGTPGFNGDGGPAKLAQVARPQGIAIDPAGNLMIADTGNNRIRRVEDNPAVAATTHFPQFVTGGGWSTHFTFTSTSSVLASARLVLTDQGAQPLVVNSQLTDASGIIREEKSSLFLFDVPPGGTVFLSTSGIDGSSETTVGWGQLVTYGGSLSSLATYEDAPGGITRSMVGVLSNPSCQSATIPVDNDSSVGKQTAYAIANPGSQTVIVKLALVNQDGSVADDSVTVALAAGQQVSRYVWQDFARSKFRGSLVLRAQDGMTFAAMGLLGKQGHFTVIPLIPGKAPGLPD